MTTPLEESDFIRPIFDSFTIPITPTPENINELDRRITDATTEALKKLAATSHEDLSKIIAGLPRGVGEIVGGYADEATFTDPLQVIRIFTQILDIFPNMNPAFKDRPAFEIVEIKAALLETLLSYQKTPLKDSWVSIRNQMERFFPLETHFGIFRALNIHMALTRTSTRYENLTSYLTIMERIKETLGDRERDSAQNIVQKVLLNFFELKGFREVRTFFCQLSLQQVKDALNRLPPSHRQVIKNWLDSQFLKNPMTEEDQKTDRALAQMTLPDPGLPLFDPKLFMAIHHLLKDSQLQAPYDRIRLAHGLAKSMPSLKTLIEEEGFKKQSVIEQANAVLAWLNLDHPEWNQITEFKLRDLGLTQLPPELIAMCKRMPNLRTLDLSYNQLRDLEGIGELTQIRHLDVYNNQIVTLPKTIARLKQLDTFGIEHNQLEDLPEEIGACNQLTVLHLKDNRLITLPDSMNDLSQLKILDIRRNRLISLPEIKPKKLEKLRELKLNDNRLKVLTASIVELKGLEFFDLENNQLKILPDLTGLLSLLTISLHNNPLTEQAHEVLKTLAANRSGSIDIRT